MSKTSKHCKREKNKWLRELEQYEKDKNGARLDWFDKEYEEQYMLDVENGLFDDWDDDLRGYEDDPIDLWEDEFPLYKPGTHVKNCRDIFLVLETGAFANLRTGQIVYHVPNLEVVLEAR